MSNPLFYPIQHAAIPSSNMYTCPPQPSSGYMQYSDGRSVLVVDGALPSQISPRHLESHVLQATRAQLQTAVLELGQLRYDHHVASMALRATQELLQSTRFQYAQIQAELHEKNTTISKLEDALENSELRLHCAQNVDVQKMEMELEDSERRLRYLELTHEPSTKKEGKRPRVRSNSLPSIRGK
jgi:hypothetical protein